MTDGDLFREIGAIRLATLRKAMASPDALAPVTNNLVSGSAIALLCDAIDEAP